MEINLNKAMNTLHSVEKQLRDQAGVSVNKPKSQAAGRDSVEIGGPKGQVHSAGYTQLNNELAEKLASLTGLVEENAGQQNKLAGLFGDVNNDEAIQSRAQELLDTYFSVEETGDRIFNFAFSFYGGEDREGFAAKMKDAIYEGFNQAEKQLGGLADISLETRDYIDGRINDFLKEGEESETQQPVLDQV